MVSLSDNGIVSMDVTFDTNDVKFHLFTLILFDPHHIRVPVAWLLIMLDKGIANSLLFPKGDLTT
jgi:hypothetical protein